MLWQLRCLWYKKHINPAFSPPPQHPYLVVPFRNNEVTHLLESNWYPETFFKILRLYVQVLQGISVGQKHIS